jgi:hypothetical protein
MTAAALLSLGVPSLSAQGAHGPSKYLFAWVGDGAHTVSDFLTVIDADPASKAYGHVVATLPVGMVGTMPHHTEYEFPADGMLLANGFAAGTTFLFDLRKPTAPRLVGHFDSEGPYSFPHSFVRLPNGHLLGTFQGAGRAYRPPGGLVEIDEHGRYIRSASAVGPGLDSTHAWPYSLDVDPAHDRAVVTITEMPTAAWAKMPPGSWTKSHADSVVTTQIQVWSLSQLRLLKTIELPAPKGATYNRFPAEPRLLPDGSMYVNTFNCGLYHLTGVQTPNPQVRLVHTFPYDTTMAGYCSVPVIIGHYLVQTVGHIRGLITLDITNPDKPVEVSRLVLDPKFAMPHWLAADRAASRVVLTGDGMGYVLVVNVDPKTGALSLDRNFRDERTGAVGVSLDGRTWPQGAIAKAWVHGTLFGPR